MFNKAEGIEIANINEMACHDIAWDEYLAVEDDKWVQDMMKAEDGKYFNIT